MTLKRDWQSTLLVCNGLDVCHHTSTFNNYRSHRWKSLCRGTCRVNWKGGYAFPEGTYQGLIQKDWETLSFLELFWSLAGSCLCHLVLVGDGSLLLWQALHSVMDHSCKNWDSCLFIWKETDLAISPSDPSGDTQGMKYIPALFQKVT